MFFAFFLSLYGLLGVQLFGDLQAHCVLNTVKTCTEVALKLHKLALKLCN